MQNIKTFMLMAGLVLIFMYVGNLIGGVQGMKLAFLISLGINFFSYFFSDKLVLKHYNAQEVNQNTSPKLYQIVEKLAQSANMPMPKVYIIPDNVPNAFATGRNPKNAAVAATQGLLNILDEQEIEGVLAHEMSHVKHYDILISSIAAIFASAIGILSNMARYNTSARNSNNNRSNGLFMLIAIILMPIAATIIRLSVSRTREYEADEGAALLTKHPEWLASALQKLEQHASNSQLQKANSQTAHMFIINPFKGEKADFSSMFSTHPSTKERIERLRYLHQKINNL